MAESWIIVSKETGKAVFETWNEKTMLAVNLDKYKAIPALAYLQNLNKHIKEIGE